MQISLDRQALHRIPELDRDLPKTLAYLNTALSQLPCRVFAPMAGALCAFFDFGKDAAIAFRADMDALPVTENTSLPFASTHPGKMHACGHDGHMAILLELARRLAAKKDLPHNVLLVFQPAEETSGGARELCETGLFEKYNVTAIFGLHLWPGLPAGEIFSRKQGLMSRSCEVTVEITGRSAHIAKASQGLDATAAATEFYCRAARLEASLPPETFRLLKFGKLQSGTVRNALSGSARLEGSLRAFRDEDFETLRNGLMTIAKEVETDTGCAVKLHMNDGYPAVMNPPALYDKVCAAAPLRQLDAPAMTTEDFSWYQKFLPGLFCFLGIGDTPALHADNFDFDESLLLKGADFFEKLAEDFQ